MTEFRFRRWLAAIAGFGAAWRLVYLFAVKIDDPLRLNDSFYYSIQAGRNSEGDWFRENLGAGAGAEHGPLTSLYLTPWSIGDWGVAQQRFAITLLGIAAVPLVGLLGRRLAGPIVGLVAAAIAAVYPNLWVNDSVVMSESLAVFLVTAALLVAVALEGRATAGRSAVLGGLIGLAALTRSELALLAPMFAALVWWRGGTARRGRALAAGALLAASLATVAPWMIYNLARFERPVLMSTNDGTTLLGANCDQTYYVDIGGWDLRCLDPVPLREGVDASIRAEQRRDIAVDYVRDHLGRVPLVVLARLGRSVDLYGLASLVDLDVGEEKAEWAVWIGIVMFWLLAVAAWFGWRRLAADGGGQRWWLVPLPLTVLITTALFYGAHRIRAPAEPVLVVLAAVGVVAVAGRLRDSRP